MADLDNRVNLIIRYKPEVQSLEKYIPWLESKKGGSASGIYDGPDASDKMLKFPVYDSTLMSFVKECQRTSFMDRNHPYVYSRNHIQTVQDEIRIIRNATILDLDKLGGILSHYILGGMTKGSMWPQAVENGVFLELLYKLRELIDVVL